MKNLKNYKNRFYSLLESKMGDVKPLINEDDYQGQSGASAIGLPAVTITAPRIGMENYKDVFVKKDGTLITRKQIPKEYLNLNPVGGCFAVALSDFWFKTSTSDLVDVKSLEADLKNQIKDGTNSALSQTFKERGCKDRLIPKTEEDLSKPGYYLAKGDRGPLVRKIQQLLINFSEYYVHMLYPESKRGEIGSGGDPNFNPLDGIFGSATESAVKHFQKEENITPISGKVGSKTWAALKNTPIKIDFIPGKRWINIQTGEPAVST
jgi:hypothetical protein